MVNQIMFHESASMNGGIEGENSKTRRYSSKHNKNVDAYYNDIHQILPGPAQ